MKGILGGKLRHLTFHTQLIEHKGAAPLRSTLFGLHSDYSCKHLSRAEYTTTVMSYHYCPVKLKTANLKHITY